MSALGQFLSVIPRTWTIDGQKVEATFISDYEGVVTLSRSDDGQPLEVKHASLCETDREFIRSLSTEIPEFEPPPGPIKVRGRVIKVTDGDTLTLLVNGQAFKCRLLGIDAPELKQPFGAEAGRALHAACFGKVVEAEGHGNGHYGRQLVVVKLKKKNLNYEMVKRGLAWHFRKMGVDPKLAEAQAFAKRRRKGLWRDKLAVEPWKYRDEVAK